MSEATVRVGEPSALRAAALGVAMRIAPSHGVPEQRHLAVLAETEAPDLPVAITDAFALTLAALLHARARRDALHDGCALIDRYATDTRLLRPSSLGPAARSLLLSSMGEYLCAAGDPQRGARYATEALLFAGSSELRYRALCVAALGHAFNGEYDTAENEMLEARHLFDENGWHETETEYTLLLAETLNASARLDAGRLRAINRTMRRTHPHDPYADFTADAVEVMHMLVTHDITGGMARCWELLNGARRHQSQQMVRDFLTCLRADILIAQGSAHESLASLAGRDSLPGHGICFAMQRAGALLHLQRDREVLAETEDCVTPSNDHCLRTLNQVLIQRAVALSRLGSARRAEQSMEAGLLLTQRLGGAMTPFGLLPPEETRRLLDGVERRRPELSPIASVVRKILPAWLPASDHVSFDPGLTPAERTLLSSMAKDQSLAEIARERHVSLNTVKSQVRSIYAKLGVAGRAEAVARASEMAF